VFVVLDSINYISPRKYRWDEPKNTNLGSAVLELRSEMDTDIAIHGASLSQYQKKI